MPDETVPPSPEPEAATAAGTGADKPAAPPTPPEESAGTTGMGTASDQQGAGAPPGDAPYDLSDDDPRELGAGEGDQPPRSPSGV